MGSWRGRKMVLHSVESERGRGRWDRGRGLEESEATGGWTNG